MTDLLPEQFLCSLGYAARESAESTAGAYFEHLYVGVIITAGNKALWVANIPPRRIKYSDLTNALKRIAAEKAALAARGTRIPMKAEVLYIEGHAPSVDLKGRVNLALKGTYHRFGVGAVARGQSDRKEQGGPLVEGPWAFAFGLSSCISASKAMQEKDAEERAQDVVVEDGSKLVIDGVSYTVKVERREFIKLIANEETK